MNDIKVSVDFALQGRVQLTQEEAVTLEKENVGTGFNKESLTYYNPAIKKKETINYSTLKHKSIQQTLNITKGSYKYLISKESCPTGVTMFIWGKLNAKERLKKHFELIAQDLNATLKGFTVFPD